MNEPILQRLQQMQNYFASGATKTYEFRYNQLILLKNAILEHEKELHAALYTDLKKAKKNAGLRKRDF